MEKNHLPRAADDTAARHHVDVGGHARVVRGSLPDDTGRPADRRARRVDSLTHDEADLRHKVVHGSSGVTTPRGATVGREGVGRMHIGGDTT